MASTISGFLYFDNDANSIDSDPTTGGVEPAWSGATVQLYSANGSTLIATTTSNAYGYYAFTGQAQGTYSLRFETAVNYRADQGYVDPATGYSWVTGITTDGTTNTLVNEGFYQAASVGGVVSGPSGQGVDGVTVALLDGPGKVVATTL